MRLDFTDFFTEKESHLDDNELRQSYADAILAEMEGIPGQLVIEYFESGAVVTIDGEYYGTWNYRTRSFYRESVGDYNY